MKPKYYEPETYAKCFPGFCTKINANRTACKNINKFFQNIMYLMKIYVLLKK